MQHSAGSAEAVRGGARETAARPEPREQLARVLALLVASKGHVANEVWHALADDDACRRIGIGMPRFEELVDRCTRDIGADLQEHAWLGVESLRQIDRALAEVTDLDDRLLVCRLAASVLRTGDPRVGDNTLVLDHTLARWHLTLPMLAQRPVRHGGLSELG